MIFSFVSVQKRHSNAQICEFRSLISLAFMLHCSNIYGMHRKAAFIGAAGTKGNLAHKTINNKQMDRMDRNTNAQTQSDCDDRQAKSRKCGNLWKRKSNERIDTTKMCDTHTHTSMQAFYVMCSPNKSPVIYWQWHKHPAPYFVYVRCLVFLSYAYARNLHART